MHCYWIDKHHNCTRTGFEVHACTASSPQVRKKNLFHKLICACDMNFHEKNFCGSVPPTKHF